MVELTDKDPNGGEVWILFFVESFKLSASVDKSVVDVFEHHVLFGDGACQIPCVKGQEREPVDWRQHDEELHPEAIDQFHAQQGDTGDGNESAERQNNAKCQPESDVLVEDAFHGLAFFDKCF